MDRTTQALEDLDAVGVLDAVFDGSLARMFPPAVPPGLDQGDHA